jgi:thioredoxin
MAVIEVAIGPGLEPGVFRVEIVSSAAGEAAAEVSLDVEGLLARREIVQLAILASAVTARRILPETERPLLEAGQDLFAALLGSGPVGGRYSAAAALAASYGDGLRVVLRINDPTLAGLPWEAMFDQNRGAYVCRQDQLVRHVPVASVPLPLQVELPLRILGVASSPRGLPPLDVAKEQDQLARALSRPVGQGLIELSWAPLATWADIQDLLLDGGWHVLHFIGHGDFDSARDEGMLALEREDGSTDLVSASRLVDLLRQARPMPRLVVLNSCSGATTGTTDLFSGTAAALVRGGVSAVAAMQYAISDRAAAAFARGFYAAIARGRGVDDAVSSGRVAILGTGDQTLEWVTPVLYLRGRDAQLYTLHSSPQGVGRPQTLAAGGPSAPTQSPSSGEHSKPDAAGGEDSVRPGNTGPVPDSRQRSTQTQHPSATPSNAGTNPAVLKEVTDATFDKDVLQSQKPVIVHYWAEWCGPCRMVDPVLWEILREHGDKIEIVRLNVDENPSIAQRYNILAIPTMNVFSNGEVIKQIKGAKPKSSLLRDLAEFI